jgi:hypothetical protein
MEKSTASEAQRKISWLMKCLRGKDHAVPTVRIKRVDFYTIELRLPA